MTAPATERRYVAQYRTATEHCLTYGQANDIELARRMVEIARNAVGSTDAWLFDRTTGRRV